VEEQRAAWQAETRDLHARIAALEQQTPTTPAPIPVATPTAACPPADTPPTVKKLAWHDDRDGQEEEEEPPTAHLATPQRDKGTYVTVSANANTPFKSRTITRTKPPAKKATAKNKRNKAANSTRRASSGVSDENTRPTTRQQRRQAKGEKSHSKSKQQAQSSADIAAKLLASQLSNA
jgi:hypothetical protein